jgi:CRP-like cAMP-binding protein
VFQTMQVKAGDIVLCQGEPPDRFYVVSRGRLSVTQHDGEKEIELGRLGPGEYFGAIGLLSNRRRGASVRAVTDVELLALDREAFSRAVEESKATALELACVAIEGRNAERGESRDA